VAAGITGTTPLTAVAANSLGDNIAIARPVKTGNTGICFIETPVYKSKGGQVICLMGQLIFEFVVIYCNIVFLRHYYD
jgi:hypothetical protein